MLLLKALESADYPAWKPGRRVELLCVTDPYTRLRSGDRGTLIPLDEHSIHVNWDCGHDL
jgi:hypothetical protein